MPYLTPGSFSLLNPLVLWQNDFATNNRPF